MIKYKQHVPPFVDGVDPEEYECESLDELLERNRDRVPENFVFSFGYPNTLMMSSTVEYKWWVLGFVRGVLLQNYLPKFDKVYKMQGDNVPIIKYLGGHDPNEEFMVMDKSRNGDYELTSLKDGHSWAWCPANETEFIRYATQGELDWVNNL